MSRDEKYYLDRKFILPDILKFLLKEGIFNDQDVAYFPENFTFSFEDFLETFNFIQEQDKRENLSENLNETWPTERSYFEIDNIKFMIDAMSGQGTICSFILDGELEKVLFQEKFKIDLNMDFLEIEFPNWIQEKIKRNDEMKKAFNEVMNMPEHKKWIDDWRKKYGK